MAYCLQSVVRPIARAWSSRNLRDIDVGRVADDRPVRNAISSVADKLRVPNSEVVEAVGPLREHGDCGTNEAAVGCVGNVLGNAFKHFLGGADMTSIEDLSIHDSTK